MLIDLSRTQMELLIEAAGSCDMSGHSSAEDTILHVTRRQLVDALRRMSTDEVACAACGKPMKAHYRRGRRLTCEKVR